MIIERLTCSQASEDSASDSNHPDLFGQSPSVNKNPSAEPSCGNIGPTRQSTTMSAPSQQMDLEELISSAAGSLANRGQLPGSSEAQKMTATSGQSWLPLLKSYGLDGSLARMCEALLVNDWVSNAAFLTWKASATAPSHLLFQLVPSTPRTDETGSGFWPTPTAHLHKEGGYPAEYTRNTPTLTAEATQSEGKPHSSGSLNPTWVEWLMGFPIGWTDLKHSETPSSRKSSRKSGGRSSQRSAAIQMLGELDGQEDND